MYMVNRGPRHPLRNLNRRSQRINDIAPIHNNTENAEDGDARNLNISEMSSPKPVFNSKKTFSRSNSNNTAMTQDLSLSAQTEDAARFLADAWYRTQHDYEMCTRQGRDKGPVVYQEKVHTLQGFEPFDLDQWMAKRTLQKYQQ